MFKKILFIFLVPFLGLARADAEESVLTIYTDCKEPIDLEVEESPTLYKIESCDRTYTVFYNEDSTSISIITWEGEKSPEQVEKEISSGNVTGNLKTIIKDSLTKRWESLRTKKPLF